jgi:hypothetical protein
MATTNPDQAVLLARYKENADQARHHETLRERSTAVVAQTTGVLLGLMGFKEGSLSSSHVVPLISSFIVLLGLWGLVSSIIFNSRARRHRRRIDKIRAKLEGYEKEDVGDSPWRQGLNWVWVIFHSLIVVLGVSIMLLQKHL